MQTPTLRQNGQMMATVRVEYHIGLSELAGAVMRNDPDDLSDLTRAQVETWLRRELEDRGYVGMDGAAGAYTLREVETVYARVSELFPEFH